jgi:glycosyltransferase involved in cell wall biosynthesis
VITMHGGRYYATGAHRRLALRTAVRASGGAVAVSDAVGRRLRSDLWLSAPFVSVIPNGVRPAAPGPATLRRELNLAPGDPLIVAVGNLYPVKGHAHLIAGFAAIANEFPTAHLAIAGRGELRDALQECAVAHHIADRVHLLGLRADVAGVLASADLFAMPSLAEGMPLSLLEALFRGLPVVATDVGEVRQMLAGGAGVVVEPANSAQLAIAMRGILRDPSRARSLGEVARGRAATKFDLQHTVDRYADLYVRYLMRAAEG